MNSLYDKLFFPQTAFTPMMKPLIISALLLLFALVSFYGWKFSKIFFAKDYDKLLASLYNHTVPLITTDSIQNLNDYIVLDTRAKKEWEVSHLPQAIWVDYPKANFDCLKNKTKDQAILVYCSVGYRSEKIGEQLQKLGFTQVYNLYGGIFDWANQNQPLINSSNSKTNQVHGYSPSWGKWLNSNIEKVYD